MHHDALDSDRVPSNNVRKLGLNLCADTGGGYEQEDFKIIRGGESQYRALPPMHEDCLSVRLNQLACLFDYPILLAAGNCDATRYCPSDQLDRIMDAAFYNLHRASIGGFAV